MMMVVVVAVGIIIIITKKKGSETRLYTAPREMQTQVVSSFIRLHNFFLFKTLKLIRYRAFVSFHVSYTLFFSLQRFHPKKKRKKNLLILPYRCFWLVVDPTTTTITTGDRRRRQKTRKRIANVFERENQK